VLARNGEGAPHCADSGDAQECVGWRTRHLPNKTENFQTQPASGRHGLSNAGHVPVAGRGEENDTYPVVAPLNGRWRVIVCKNSTQWILQTRRGGPDSWRGRSFCSTREALVRCARLHAGDIAPDALVVLLRLPARIGGAP
jgi:hypothetical protein